MMRRALRAAWVTRRLTPFVVSFLRDYRGWILVGEPRELTDTQHQRRARAVRIAVQELGASFIKGAQIFAQREDFLSPIYTKELKKLLDEVPPFALGEVRAVIRRNFGAEAEEIFERFDERPLGAASLGQVHRARYQGREVVVKVLRPGVEELVATDLGVVAVLMNLLQPILDDNLMGSFRAVMAEYRRMMALEMDFRNERLNADRLRRNFAKDPFVVIPKFEDTLSTRQVSVLEFIEGTRIDRVQELEARGVGGPYVLDLLVRTYVRMAVVHGFIHADPHPGNLLIDAKRRLVLLDFGMALEFDEATRTQILRLMYSVTKRDVDAIIDCFYKLEMVDPSMNKGEIRAAARRLLEIQLEDNLSPRQIQEIAKDILETFQRFPVRLPHQLVYAMRASSLVEGIALQYDPNYNAVKEATPIVKRVLSEIAFDASKNWFDRLTSAAAQAISTTREVVSIANRLDREQLRIRLHDEDLEQLQDFLGSFFRRLLVGLGLLGVALALILLSWMAQPPIFLIAGLSVVAVTYFILILWPNPGRRTKRPYFK